MAYMSPGGPQRIVLFEGVTTDEQYSQSIDLNGYPHIVIYFVGSADTISSGVLTIEESDRKDAALWASISTVNASDVSAGAQKAVRLSIGAYGFVRVRVSTAVGGGGTVSAYLRAC